MNTTLTVGAGLGGICLLSTKAALRSDVLDAAAAVGIERFVPAMPPPTTILRESMKSVGEDLFGKRRKQPIAVRRLDATNEFECVRVVPVPGQSRNRYEFLFSASISNWQAHVLDIGTGGPLLMSVYDALSQRVQHLANYLPGPVVSQVIVRGLKSWGALSLVEHGGAWFLDGRFLDLYREFAKRVRGNGDGPKFTVTQFEIGSDPDTVAHVLDLLGEEIQAGVQAIMDDVVNAEGGMSDRSINVRLARANTFLDKVRQYESMLGKPMPTLVDAIESAKQAVAVNKLLATAV